MLLVKDNCHVNPNISAMWTTRIPGKVFKIELGTFLGANARPLFAAHVYTPVLGFHYDDDGSKG